MKRLVLFSLIVMFCLPFVYGQQRFVAATWYVAFTHPLPTLGNDFHINMDPLSGNNRIPFLHDYWVVDLSHQTNWYMNGITLTQATEDPIIWHGFVDYQIEGENFIMCGDILHFGITFRVNTFRSIRPRMAWWTWNGEHLFPNARVIGFQVWSWGGTIPEPTAVTLFNDSDEAMVIEQLEFAVTPYQVSLENMSADGLGLPGKPGSFNDVKWTSANKSIFLEKGASIDVELEPLGVKIYPGQFLQFKSNVNGLAQWSQSEQ